MKPDLWKQLDELLSLGLTKVASFHGGDTGSIPVRDDIYFHPDVAALRN